MAIESSEPTPALLPLVAEEGNRRVICEWIGAHEEYVLCGTPDELETADFDCCILDVPSLLDRGAVLSERKARETAILPYILLLESASADETRAALRERHPDYWAAVDGVVEIPISEYHLAERVETLVRMRRRSIAYVRQQEQLRAIRDEHAGHGVLLMDTEGIIEYVNEALLGQTGYDRDALLGRDVRLLRSDAHDETFYDELWATIERGEVWHGVMRNRRANGEEYVVDQTAAPIRDAAGEIHRFVGVNHEITELKELEGRLRTQREQLEVLNRVLRHDIRNDMMVILGWAGTLEDHVTGDGQETLERIQAAGEHVVELTTVTGELVATITGTGDPDLEPVGLHQVLTEEVAKRQTTFEGASIRMPDPPDPGTRVMANELLASVFRNLINNAVQHNDTAQPEVTIRAGDGDGVVLLRVADNGPGVPEEAKAQIFGESERGLESEGTGMGLFLVQSLVERYGGSVWVEDNEPTGAVFVVELPMAENPEDLGTSVPS